MGVYTVKETAKLSGVSVRTLHHYDEIGLLKPACLGANGYRYYGRDELLRLQQILFHRELGFPLEEIRQVLSAPDFDRVAALRAHRERLMGEIRRYRRLVRTLDATLAALEGETDMDDKAMYRGFSAEKQAEHEAWLVARLGGQVQARIDAAKTRMKDWSKADFDRHLAEVEQIEVELAQALTKGLPTNSPAVGDLIRQLHAWVGRGWNDLPNRQAFIGLAKVYQEHPDFRARYESRAPGLTDYMAKAIGEFAERELA
ncbi:DNA-binding transcriptional regulator, MerR family [Rhizobiales bacterium GAS191]|nr:DNA-binding transcriptional regulator, MerR family [Rhizobiales bacterium GAS191]